MKSSSQLYPSEWIIVLLFCGSITALSLYSWWQAEKPLTVQYGKEVWVKPPLVSVTFAGAFERPGEYLVERGTPIKEALKMASPLPDADLSKLNLKGVIKGKRRISLPHKRKTLRKI